jgi:hypothetical protein
MVGHPHRRQFGAGCVQIASFLAVLAVQGSSVAKAGFIWTSDWQITTQSSNNGPVAMGLMSLAAPPSSQPNGPGDSVELSGQSFFAGYNSNDSYSTTAYAQRQFELTGYSSPVKVTIQTVIDGWATFNAWGLRATLMGASGIDNNMQTYQRSMLLPGTNQYSIVQSRDIWLNNGTYTFTANIKPTITPSSFTSLMAQGYVEGRINVGIVVVPEPSSLAATGTGLCVLGIYMRYKRRRLKSS